MLPINSHMHPYINHALMKLNGRGQTKTERQSIHRSVRGIETMRAIDAFSALSGKET